MLQRLDQLALPIASEGTAPTGRMFSHAGRRADHEDTDPDFPSHSLSTLCGGCTSLLILGQWEQEFCRTLLLVGELPDLFEGAQKIHEADDLPEDLHSSYDPAAQRTKRRLHLLLSVFARCPFETLERSLCSGNCCYGLICQTKSEQAEFQPEQL